MPKRLSLPPAAVNRSIRWPDAIGRPGPPASSAVAGQPDRADAWGRTMALGHQERAMSQAFPGESPTAPEGSPISAPFDTSGVTRGPDGIKRYDRLTDSLVHMLPDTVESHPDREALAETGGRPRATHRGVVARAAPA